ncbi:hypothetical protein SEA_SAMISTI12_116 [Streptomyces phage Samisti12]|uniref:DUF3307 domain-containing protein n=7 Tax=Samistivirus TaxID=2560220 RepID=A0A223G011_9CAUD|nr:DUF3307 domain-containing protein [Streptomyces phage Peebs]YP_009611546.1 DUF3307 domain-containing protein [Streptomyces phage Samisti12]YP_010101528.1 DUF3307 domain-containing protein [Streptomyces phage EGole]ASR76537.1 hypothetical protein SEA_SUSHI23_114 [Streptomyces phage Sushi23]QAX95842.1 hypothetical protein SEA_TEUTSCH_115 [Streptomyces phage Teutsch]QGH78297.1 hypothetical protein SEA_TRIBUTE_113 [Streptomyces phage Tribute]QRI46099.1 hypothetical protein SEA_CROSS_115 [Strep
MTAALIGVLLHFVGDYIIQTDWMAQLKTKRWAPAIVHGVTYGVPFLFVTMSPIALAVIIVTHIVIDHYRLARHVVWAKNQLAPKEWRYSWSEGNLTGYRNDGPPWLNTWLMIIADNTIHVIINTLAILYL